MTIAPAILTSLRAGRLPGAALPGVLEGGWCGPVEWDPGDGDWLDAIWTGDVALVRDSAGPTTKAVWWAWRPVSRDQSVLRLDVRVPECRLRVAEVLAAGERCSCADGQRWGRGGPDEIATPETCPDCRGSGYLRPPTPCWHLLPQSEVGPGGLAPELARHAPELVACHVALVLGGKLGIGGVHAPWRQVADNDPDTGETWIRFLAVDPFKRSGGLWACARLQPWRAFGWENSCIPADTGLWTRGPETGDAGRACADAAALAAGFALMEADGSLRAPWPEVA